MSLITVESEESSIIRLMMKHFFFHIIIRHSSSTSGINRSLAHTEILTRVRTVT